MKTVVVIPARLESTRLPRKILATINGHPLLWYVWSNVMRAQKLDAVYVASDSEEILNAVRSWGGHGLLTSKNCRSGTERIASLLGNIEAELWINVQGDEPFVSPFMIDALIEKCQAGNSDLVTPVFRVNQNEDLWSPNVVKVVRALDGRALYFSRQPLPYLRDIPTEDWLATHSFWGHIGVYAYRQNVLARYAQLPDSPLEAAEKLEQLRFLEAGYVFQTIETDYHPVSVDTPEDLERVRQMMAEGGSNGNDNFAG